MIHSRKWLWEKQWPFKKEPHFESQTHTSALPYRHHVLHCIVLQVIYALNTKNDEHEAIVSSIREQHEEQQQQLMGEMRLKIEFYREKISQDAAYATQIRALQEHVESQGEEQRRTLEEFSSYKQHTEENEQVFYLIFNCTHVRTYSMY